MLYSLKNPKRLFCIGNGIFPKGECTCEEIIDYGLGFDLLWLCFMDADNDRKCYLIPNNLIRGIKNASLTGQ